MKQLQLTIAALVLLVIGTVVAANSAFVVDETQYAIVTQFGQPRRAIVEPGLYFRTPFIQKVAYLPKQILRWKGSGTELVTKDKTYIWADAWAIWRITDPLRFYQALRTEANGQATLDNQIESATKDVVASHNLIEVVRQTDRELSYTAEELKEAREVTARITLGRERMGQRILEEASSVATETPEGEEVAGTLETVFGMQLIDAQIQHVIYVQEVQQSVYDRMIAERKRIAQRYRSEGEEEANQIAGIMERELRSITSEGYMRAQELQGEGDAEALRIYAEAYSKDPQFYRFWRSLKAYEQAVDKETVFVLSLDNPFFQAIGDPASAPVQAEP